MRFSFIGYSTSHYLSCYKQMFAKLIITKSIVIVIVMSVFTPFSYSIEDWLLSSILVYPLFLATNFVETVNHVN